MSKSHTLLVVEVGEERSSLELLELSNSAAARKVELGL